MRALDIVAAMGIVAEPVPRPGERYTSTDDPTMKTQFMVPVGWWTLGEAATVEAYLVTNGIKVKVLYAANEPLARIADPLLHETCHAVCGAPGFEDESESGLIALNWALIQELDGEERVKATQKFFGYGLEWEGRSYLPTDKGVKSFPVLESAVLAAVEARLLTPDGRVVWRQGSRFTDLKP